MANKKSNGSTNNHTSEVADYPEVVGKIVQNVELHSGRDVYSLSIHFEDQTALYFIFESGIVAFPTLSDWTGGNETVLKEYEGIRSKIQRE